MATEAAVAQDDRFLLVFLLPDVCMTPAKGGKPIPYPITHTMQTTLTPSKNVFFAGRAAYLHEISCVDAVTGDQLGAGGGVVSHVHMEMSHTKEDEGSKSVYVNGCRLIRTGDRVWMNQKKP